MAPGPEMVTDNLGKDYEQKEPLSTLGYVTCFKEM